MDNIAISVAGVKPKPACFRVGEPEDVLSLAYALRESYRFRIRSDGNAIVIRPTGEAYHVYNWTCDCADALFRDGGSYERPSGERVCKHLVWLSQVRPCHISTCSGVMVLGGVGGDGDPHAAERRRQDSFAGSNLQ